MKSPLLLLITTWMILALNQGSDGKKENLSSEEFRILSDKIETQNEEIIKLQGQVGNCVQKQESELPEMSTKITDPEIQRHISKLGYSGIA